MENEFTNDFAQDAGQAKRPGDTSSYSTDEACGYNSQPRYSYSAGSEAANGSYAGGVNGSTGNNAGSTAYSGYNSSYNTYNNRASGPDYGSGNAYYGYSYAGYTAPPPPVKKKGRVKTFFKGLLCLILVAAIGFGGGYAGALYAGTGSSKVVTQMVERPAPGVAGSNESVGYSVADVAEIVGPSVVVVTTEQVVTSNTWFGSSYVVSGAGSGIVLSEDGYILTCAHVVDGTRSLKVTLSDGTEYDAEVVGSDTASDVAVIKIEATGLIPAVIGDSDTIRVGDTAITAGNPMGTLGGSITCGIISAAKRTISLSVDTGVITVDVIQTDAAMSPGISGGGLFNQNAELIGMTNSGGDSSESDGIGFAIPVNTVMKVAQDLIEVGHVTGRPMLGINVVAIEDMQTAMQYGVNSFGIYIVSTISGGGAEEAGIQPGDMLVSINGTSITTTDELSSVLNGYQVGDVVEVQVNRQRAMMTFHVTLLDIAK